MPEITKKVIDRFPKRGKKPAEKADPVELLPELQQTVRQKYEQNLTPKFFDQNCEKILSIFKEGKGFTEVCAELNFHTETLKRKLQDEAFSNLRWIFELGETYYKAYWERKLSDTLFDKRLNVASLIFKLKNTCGYRDTPEAFLGEEGKLSINLNFAGKKPE